MYIYIYPIIPGYSLVTHIFFHFEMDKSKEHGQKWNQNLPWTEICNQ
jgi:hypothetical protein